MQAVMVALLLLPAIPPASLLVLLTVPVLVQAVMVELLQLYPAIPPALLLLLLTAPVLMQAVMVALLLIPAIPPA
jgi:hypothetical protein